MILKKNWKSTERELMSKKEIYLAGTIGYYVVNNRNEKAQSWRKQVELLNESHSEFSIINPISYYKYNDGYQKTEKEIMRFYLNRLRKCSAVLVNLNDLDKSIGTSDEILFAYLHSIPVIGFVDNNEEYRKLHPWKIEQIDRIEVGEDALKRALEYIYLFYGE